MTEKTYTFGNRTVVLKYEENRTNPEPDWEQKLEEKEIYHKQFDVWVSVELFEDGKPLDACLVDFNFDYPKEGGFLARNFSTGKYEGYLPYVPDKVGFAGWSPMNPIHIDFDVKTGVNYYDTF